MAAVLVAISRGGLLALFVALLFFETRLTNQLRLIQTFALVFLLPAAAAWLLGRVRRVTPRIEDGALVLEEPSRRIEIPCDLVVGVTPWTVPLPSGGVWLEMSSGERFGYGLAVADAADLVETMVIAGAPPHLLGKLLEPATAYAHARGRVFTRWEHPFFKYVLFALVPTLPLFRLHQWINYGGTFGEYYAYGLEAYLLGFAIYWATSAVWLVIYDAMLGSLLEAICLTSAYVWPGGAAGFRVIATAIRRVLYYGAVAVFLGRLYLLSTP